MTKKQLVSVKKIRGLISEGILDQHDVYKLVEYGVEALFKEWDGKDLPEEPTESGPTKPQSEVIGIVHQHINNGGLSVTFKRLIDDTAHYSMEISMSNMGYKVSSEMPIHKVELIDNLLVALTFIRDEMLNRKDTFVPTYLDDNVEIEGFGLKKEIDDISNVEYSG